MDIKDIIKEENLVYKKTPLMSDKDLSYCPGCGHGTIHRLIMEVVEEMEIIPDTIAVGPVGCSVFAYQFMDVDFSSAAHGRAPAVATGIKRCWPDKYVFTYQGDGDLAAIGTAETIHACNRGENISIFYVNNGIYGMTGGQMAPTTIKGMKTTTSPNGRDIKDTGDAIKMSELVAPLGGTYYITRQAVNSPANVRKAKKAIRKAFENQKLDKGLSMIEFMSNCNSGWKCSPIEANKWMVDNMLLQFPLGDIKDKGKML